MFCEKCGDKQPDNAVFCSNCGNKMGSITSNDPVAKPAAPRPAVPTPPKPVTPPKSVPPQPVQPVRQPVQQAPPVQRPVQPVQQVQQQPVYQQSAPPRIDPLTEPLSVGAYIGMFLLLAIPFVNFIMMCIWLFSSNTNKNKKNFAIAMVLVTIIMIVLSFLLSGLIAALFIPLLEEMQYNVY